MRKHIRDFTPEDHATLRNWGGRVYPDGTIHLNTPEESVVQERFLDRQLEDAE